MVDQYIVFQFKLYEMPNVSLLSCLPIFTKKSHKKSKKACNSPQVSHKSTLLSLSESTSLFIQENLDLKLEKSLSINDRSKIFQVIDPKGSNLCLKIVKLPAWESAGEVLSRLKEKIQISSRWPSNDLLIHYTSVHANIQTNEIYFLSELCPRNFEDISSLPYSEKQIRDFVSQIVETLFFLQEQNFSLTNLKTENILIDSKGKIRIRDFISQKDCLKTSIMEGYNEYSVPVTITEFIKSLSRQNKNNRCVLSKNCLNFLIMLENLCGDRTDLYRISTHPWLNVFCNSKPETPRFSGLKKQATDVAIKRAEKMSAQVISASSVSNEIDGNRQSLLAVKEASLILPDFKTLQRFGSLFLWVKDQETKSTSSNKSKNFTDVLLKKTEEKFSNLKTEANESKLKTFEKSSKNDQKGNRVIDPLDSEKQSSGSFHLSRFMKDHEDYISQVKTTQNHALRKRNSDSVLTMPKFDFKSARTF